MGSQRVKVVDGEDDRRAKLFKYRKFIDEKLIPEQEHVNHECELLYARIAEW